MAMNFMNSKKILYIMTFISELMGAPDNHAVKFISANLYFVNV